MGRSAHRQIVADYRHIDASQLPRVTSTTNLFIDVLVHSQDIAIPLHPDHAMPAEAFRAAADRVWRRAFPFRARSRLAGLRLRATDTDWAVGERAAAGGLGGPVVEGTMADLLLLLTGRPVVLPRLTGPGVELLRERVRPTR